MGQKTHPIGFRLALDKNWQSTWHNDKRFKDLLHEDLKLRKFLQDYLKSAGLSRVEILRKINETEININVAKPGLVIGRGGVKIEELKKELIKFISGKLKLNVIEVKKPMLSAKLVAEGIANQISRRYPYKRAVSQTIDKVVEAGAKGVKIEVSGVLGGPSSIARTERKVVGSIPASTLKSNVDFNTQVAATHYGTIGVKVWIYKE